MEGGMSKWKMSGVGDVMIEIVDTVGMSLCVRTCSWILCDGFEDLSRTMYGETFTSCPRQDVRLG